MTPERYAQACALFDRAVELPAADRTAFLDRACGADDALRAEVEGLLAHDPGPPHGAPTLPLPRPWETGTASSLTGALLGPYRVERPVGSGGMGSVYLATRVGDYHQQVAIKVIRSGLDTAALVDRFRAERQALARLNHPHIARLLDGGTTPDGLPYLVMEYLDGRPIDAFCDAQRLPTRERVRLVRLVCAAVEHAHDNGIIHRDLKPSNVLMTADGGPKVVDFGLARILRGVPGAVLTEPGAVLGTPGYMPPEQAGGDPEAVGPAADVYALGAILYELLTGRPPFRAETPLATLKQVLTEEPLPPSRLHPHLPRDLETICLRCLQKDPHRRYPGAAALADDLGRFLDGRPVLARRSPWWERVGKWARRRPAVASLLMVGTLAAVALVVLGTIFNARLAEERDQARAHQAQAQRNLAAALQAVRQHLLLVSRHPRLRVHDLDELRQTLLEKAVTLCEEITSRPAPDPEAEALQGRAYLLLALIRSETGRREEAVRLQEKGLAIFERLGRDRPEVNEYRDDRATSLNNLGNWHLLAGRFQEADAAFRQAETGYRELVAARPSDPNYRHGLAGTWNNLGALALARGKHQDALAWQGKAVPVREALVRDLPWVAEYRHQLGVSLFNQAMAQERLEKYADAVGSYRRALATLEPLAAKGGTLPEHLGSLARTRLFLGDLYGAMNRTADAEPLLRQALAGYEALARDHPAVSAHAVGLGMSHSNLGRFLTHRKNRHEEAIASFDRAAAILERVVKAEPQHADAHTVLVATLRHRVHACRQLGRHADALQTLDRVVALIRGPRQVQVRAERAYVLTELGRWAEATAAAAELAKGALLPDDAEELARVFGRAAAFARREGRAAEALEKAGCGLALLRRAATGGAFATPERIHALTTEDAFAGLRDHPGWIPFLKELRGR